MQEYNKLIVALVGALVAGVQAYYGENSQLATTLIAIVSALGVYAVKNKK